MRLDKYLAENGFSSRTKAARAIEKGLVTLNGRTAKASDEVAEGDRVEVRAEEVGFASEGGQKLYKALRAFGASVGGQVFADLGASTGGFTDCLLQNGAARVYAVDVGESQLAPHLARDTRVVVMDRTNARYLGSEQFPEPIDGVTVDVSFISLTLILPAVARILREGGLVIYPTDTVYAIGCDALNVRAVERICRLKGVNPQKSNLSIICYDLSNLSEYRAQKCRIYPVPAKEGGCLDRLRRVRAAGGRIDRTVKVMGNSERYTEAQKKLLKFEKEDLTEAERKVLRRALLPRKRYIPQTDEEGFSLTRDMLDKEKYIDFCALAEEIRASYRGTTTRWMGGNRWWRQRLCFLCDKTMLCALAVTVDHFRLQIEFGERECRLFEKARESFPREEIQWLFDTAVWKNGKKLLQIDPSSLVSFELLFRLLAIKRIPDEDHFSLYYDFRR